ncbi:PIN domain-containing protein [Tersicoccus solisilvae]|uniref:PIN domain-containing protein n=1 Tax=Tersicoccus solisilvae TaxID=1882339 RepID=A0ABQ1NKY8_9MICC|nr:PIN domain-containing protein [Tersicoccus solisilvae]GGC79798.1 PIN domain-containing protein [Tersicoccus solisilvae]
MARFAAFLDACVLVPIAPCDTLLRMAESGAFRPLWLRRVVDEALRALERIHPDLDPSRFRIRFRSMDEAFEDALVDGWEPLERGIELPDPNDRHVVAAALLGRADVIVTENVKDFPSTTLRPLGLETVRLDDFLLDQFDLSPVATRRVIVDQARATTRPPVPVEDLLEKLRRSGAPEFASAVGKMLVENPAEDV